MNLHANLTAFDLLGHQLGDYHIEKILGQGGVANVFQVHHQPTGQVMALKMLKYFAMVQTPIREGLRREYDTTAVFKHPGLVKVYEHGQLGGRDYITLSLIRGQSLQKMLWNGPLTEPQAVQLVQQIALALDHVHQQGFVHRDIKPANILVTPNGRAVITDFGLAVEQGVNGRDPLGGVFGTPRYMAPEQIVFGRPIDGRADLYALGTILYELLTGQTPFRGARDQQLYGHVHYTPLAPSELAHVSPDVERVIWRALAKTAEKRFSTGAEMAQVLHTAELLPAPTRPQRWFGGFSLPQLITQWRNSSANVD